MLSWYIRVLTTDTNELSCIVWFYNVLQKPIYDKLVWIITNQIHPLNITRVS